MRLATWNVNSLNARLPRVEAWLDEVEPDVLCLQETKLADSAFPALTFTERGYDSFHVGEGRWNGVAILSRIGLDDPIAGFADGAEPDPEARLATARCGDVTVITAYVPNGREVGHDHYQYKLDWMARLLAHLEKTCDPAEPVIVCGDFNIAPTDGDVWKASAFEGATHVTPPERDALARLAEWGLTDLFRQHHDAGGLFSWWDYRRGDFHNKRGMRIDLVLGTTAVAQRCTWALIDRNARKGTSPSDHAPVVVGLDQATGR